MRRAIGLKYKKFGVCLLIVALATGVALTSGVFNNQAGQKGKESETLPKNLNVPENLSSGYAERINQIIGRAENGLITWGEASSQIQEVLSTASRHEIPPWKWHSPPSTIIEQGSGIESADYIVFTDGEGNYYAKSGDNGEIQFSGTDAATVINNVLSGGDVKVSFTRGTYTVSSTLKIYSNTVLDLTGATIKLADGADANVFEEGETPVSNVKIKNGTIDGNKANQTSAGQGLRIDQPKNWIIDGIHTENTLGDGVFMDNGSRVTLKNFIIENTDDYGTRMQNIDVLKVLNGTVDNVASSGIVLKLGTPSYHAVIKGNTVKETAAEGIIVQSCHYFTVVGNTVDSGKRGILLDAPNPDYYTKYGTVEGNSILSSYHGIQMSNGVQYCTVTNNTIKVTGDGYEGIKLSSAEQDTTAKNTQHNLVIGNELHRPSNAGYAVEESESGTAVTDYNRIINNEITGTWDMPPIQTVGDNTVVKRLEKTFVSVHLSADQSITAGSWETVAFDNENADTLGEFDNSNYVFQPQREGKYLITVDVTFAGAADNRYGVMLRNATDGVVLHETRERAASVSFDQNLGFSQVCKLNPSDNYDVRAINWDSDGTVESGRFTKLTIRRVD